MRFDDSKINPLKDFLDSIPEAGTPLTHTALSRIAMFFNSGGVFCENWNEVESVLKILTEMNLVYVVKQEGILTLYKVKHG